ncbi:Replication initiation and membrane attachment [Geobacillus sp. BCO2]|nr:Replication initiation and membrane attachment [Geobacillus sp. BCO2]
MSNLLFDDQPLVILPQLALAIGLNESIVVQQLHYWLKKSENVHDGLREKINAWVDDASEELVLEALKIAVENGAKRWVYVETILRDWMEKGYRHRG